MEPIGVRAGVRAPPPKLKKALGWLLSSERICLEVGLCSSREDYACAKALGTKLLVQPSPASSNTLLGGGTLSGLLPGGGATTIGCFREPHLLAGPAGFRPQWLPRNREQLWLTFLLVLFLRLLAPPISRSFPYPLP